MSSEPRQPLFSDVGRASGRATDPRSRTFHLVIVIGILVATGALFTELAERGRWVTVTVTMDGPALEPEGSEAPGPAAPVTPVP